MSAKQPPQRSNTQAASSSSSGATVFNGHVLPPDDSKPDEPPPPYSPADPNIGTGVNYNPPGLPPPQPPRPHGNAHSSTLSNYSYNNNNNNQWAPPPASAPRPSTRYQGYPGSQAQQQYSPAATIRGRPVSSGVRPPPPPQPNTRVPFTYPPGYWCAKCSNTGVKHKNGKTCQDCYRNFAHQSPNVQVMPSMGSSSMFGFGFPMTMGYSSGGMAPGARVVRPGDPSLGGMLCGRCRGTGVIYEFLFDDTCPTCRGVGRLF